MIRLLSVVALLALGTAPGLAGHRPVASRSTQATRDAPRPRAGTAVIRGRVFAADTRMPLGRARLTWISESRAGEAGQTRPAIVTGADGRYEIRDLRAGRYRVLVRRTGYLSMEFGARRAIGYARSAAADAERGVTIDLSDGQEFDTADFNLARAGVITGRVVDEYGDPIVSAPVVASRVATVGGRRQTIGYAADTTDDEGEYRLFGLPPASYYVMASAPPSLQFFDTASYADTFYPGAPRLELARPVAVATGQEAANIDVVFSPVRLASITGTITTSRGTAPSAGSVQLVRHSEGAFTQTFNHAGAWNRAGVFSLRSVAPGSYDINVVVTDRGATEVASVPLLVTGDDISGLTIATAAEGRISGTVRTDSGAALPVAAVGQRPETSSLRVAVIPIDDSSSNIVERSMRASGQPGTGWVAANGNFVLPVSPGPCTIGLAGLPAGWAVLDVTAADRNVTDTAMDLAPGSATTVQIVISNRMAQIGGTVVDQDGKPAWDYTVVLIGRDGTRMVGSPRRSERPNQRGEFLIDRVRPGEYYVAALEDIDAVDWSQPDSAEGLQAGATPVHVALNEKKTIHLKVVRPAGN